MVAVREWVGAMGKVAEAVNWASEARVEEEAGANTAPEVV